MKNKKTKKLLFFKETVQNLTVREQFQIKGGGGDDDGPDTGKPVPTDRLLQKR